ncbi:uncharacterized protein PITG_02847 [Phytophthora infestans T30-4]|uniref:WRKY19-like zinc finger domain-containing protein n=2 Tax=Phytophthora infestans TaxID=4787 RepID=D0MXD1_PHYIT|nr:uncharacterized protein PITG_02847 [Phytophthora infestans T30-4]EEY64294.1 conserved hypothetical protein [Phytophthora infestans T30-4]KAF4136534.1 hypothetical protein GN958_ATG14209 [Phytophthora infestans]KAI9986292.1 hypothetical protein PInf_025230 [Phytophthora infestans]|eukprot:XP_002907730.1 conserved hypothetical protein [Phytophthora infestans T30-4]
MEWNHSRYQSPRAFLQQPLRPRYWYYDNEEEGAQQVWQRDVSPQPSRYSNNELASTPPIPSLKMESPGPNGSNGNGPMSLQSFSSLGMGIPQLEDSTEIQSFLLPQNAAFTINPALSPVLPPPPSQLQHQYGAQLPLQLSSQFSEFTAEPASYYPSPMPVPPLPTPRDTTRSSEDYFAEGIPTLHSVHGSVPTLPLSFGSLEQTQQQQPHAALEDQNGGLSEPFTQMATAQEPKFSPDKRKLCCVEGCKSQARAFNRCKRHGGSKRCSSPGCTKSVQSRGLCIRHGGGSRCQEPGCTRASQSHGRCKMHGGGRPCIVAGCEKKAHLKRLCRRHGGGAKCCVSGCEKWAQRQGMCMTHSKVVATQPTAIGIIGDVVAYGSPPPPSASDSPPPSMHMLTEV